MGDFPYDFPHGLIKLFVSLSVCLPRYLPEVYNLEKDVLKNLIKDMPVSVMFDETPDAEGRCVLNIMVSPLAKDKSGKIRSYLIDTVFLDKCNHSTVANAAVNALNDIGVKPEDVISIDTDNAAYMLKAYNTSLKALYPNSIHVTCLAHIMNLVGEAFRKPFGEVNTFMRYFSQVFWQAGARKRRYLSFLNTSGTTAKMAPNPCGTRWNSWYHAAAYHAEHFALYKSFFEQELAICGASAPNSLEQLHAITQDTNLSMTLQLHLNIIAEKSQVLVQLCDQFEGNTPLTMKVFDTWEDLQITFAANKELKVDACDRFFAPMVNLPYAKKQETLAIFEQAYQLAEDKLSKYMNGAQPAMQFLKDCRVFNPRCIILFSEDEDLSSIPGFEDVPKEEIHLYFTKFGPTAVKASVSGVIDTDLFWHSMQEPLPQLSRLAKRYKDCVTNSADVERSNSIYKLVLSSRRRSLSEPNIKALVFLYVNLKVQCAQESVTEESNDGDDDYEDEE